MLNKGRKLRKSYKRIERWLGDKYRTNMNIYIHAYIADVDIAIDI